MCDDCNLAQGERAKAFYIRIGRHDVECFGCEDAVRMLKGLVSKGKKAVDFSE